MSSRRQSKRPDECLIDLPFWYGSRSSVTQVCALRQFYRSRLVVEQGFDHPIGQSEAGDSFHMMIELVGHVVLPTMIFPLCS